MSEITVNPRKRIFSSSIIQVVVTVFVSIAVALAIGECIVYLLFKDSIVLFPRYVTDVQYNDFQIRGNVPNAHYRHKSADGEWEFSINSKGFRDAREFDYAKSSDVIRVLVLGDSFTIGYEVNQTETYASIAERYLRDKGLNVEVINAGISGSSNAEELVFLEQEGMRYQPDMVVLGFFHNDLEDNLKANLYQLEKEQLILQKKEYLPAIRIRNFLNSIGVYRWLSENSYLHNYLNHAATVYVKERLAQKNFEQVKKSRDQVSGLPLRMEEYRERLGVKLVEKMSSIANDEGASFILVDIATLKLKPSFPRIENLEMKEVADSYINSSLILKDYDGLIDLYRPHGHHHWTEFSHLMVGMELGEVIMELLGEDKRAMNEPF